MRYRRGFRGDRTPGNALLREQYSWATYQGVLQLLAEFESKSDKRPQKETQVSVGRKVAKLTDIHLISPREDTLIMPHVNSSVDGKRRATATLVH